MLKQVCDRYGTCRDVETYRIVVQRVGEGNQSMGPPQIDRTFHLGPRGLLWLTKLVDHGIAKLPSGEAKAE